MEDITIATTDSNPDITRSVMTSLRSPVTIIKVNKERKAMEDITISTTSATHSFTIINTTISLKVTSLTTGAKLSV